MVGRRAKLRPRLLLLGVHHIANSRRFRDPKIGHEARLRIRAAGHRNLQPVHTVGERDSLHDRHTVEESTRIRIRKSKPEISTFAKIIEVMSL